MANKLSFFETDPDVIAADLRANYEALTNKQLYPSQVEYIVFDAVAYRLSLKAIQANETANKCLVAFATGPALDELGKLLGVTRLPSATASTIIRFTLVGGHGPFVIPAGIRVQSIDGQAIFITTEAKAVQATDSDVDVNAECTKEGKLGNQYAPGSVNVVLDPQAYVATAVNTQTTGGGSDEETDEELRERILLAPSQFSVAGPTGAYKFFAKSANANIVDVAVTTGKDPITSAVIPGQVDIYPLMDGGTPPPTQVMNDISAICNDEKVRPLTDTVVVKSPQLTLYHIEVELTLLNDAVQADVEAKVTENLQGYIDERKNKLGLDVIRTQIIGRCMVPGVYKVDVIQPATDQVMQPHQYALNSTLQVSTIGFSDQ
jgi:phage-related baseplate assembly protein